MERGYMEKDMGVCLPEPLDDLSSLYSLETKQQRMNIIHALRTAASPSQRCTLEETKHMNKAKANGIRLNTSLKN